MSTTTKPLAAPLTPSYAQLLALQELVDRIASQVDSAHREIGETRAILNDAVLRLMPAFTAMRNGDTQHEALDRSSAQSGTSATSAIATRATRAIGPAFSALQFQDISDQLLAHAQGRLASLATELNAIASALAPDASGHAATNAFMAIVARASDTLALLDVSLVKPVGKAHLGTGDMELF